MTERDPHGKDPHAGGAKLDAGKPTYAMTLGYFARALAAVNTVSEYGARKYTHGGWRTVPDGEARYQEAMLRHTLAALGGEACDADTGLLHKAHAAWNALATLELALHAAGEQERVPVSGAETLPSWDDAPAWATLLLQHDDGEFAWAEAPRGGAKVEDCDGPNPGESLAHDWSEWYTVVSSRPAQ